MKKILFPILATVLIAFAIMPLAAETVFANTIVDEQGVEYTLNDANRTAVVSGCTNNLQDSVDIPRSVSGCTVTSIGDYAFQGCENLTSITLPESVTSIGDSAFQESGLGTITFAFGAPSQLTSIGDSAFKGCKNLRYITLPESVTSIGESTFQGTGLTTITFESGSGLTSIGASAFQGCGSLTSITIPNNVTIIGESAFQGSGLTTITFESGSGLTSVGASAFQGCGSLTSITIPNNVTSIGESAFQGTGLAIIIFESGNVLESIGDSAFQGCENLLVITIPANVTSIGDSAFKESGLASIAFDSSRDLTSIGESAFQGCENLSAITIPMSVTSIGDSAFQGTGLTTITFNEGSSLTSIGEAAFQGLNITTITIPASVTSIGAGAFTGSGLTLIHYLGDETAWGSVTKGNNWAPSNTAIHFVPNKATRKATPDADGYLNGYICNEEGCGDWGYEGTVIRRPVISLSETSFDYDGTVKKPEVSVKDTAGQTIAASNYSVTIRNSAGTEVTDPKDEGIYYVNVTMQGEKYEGTKVLAYTIGDPISIQDAEVVLSATEYTYNGTVQKPDIVTIGGMDLTEGTDYTAVWSNESSMDAGTYTVTITGNEYYPGTATASYMIDPKAVTVKANNASKTYGKNDPAKFTATVSGLLGTDTLTYTVARETGENTGTYAIKPTGETAQGNYTVTYENGTFTIDPKAVTPTVKVSNKVYTGKALKPVVTVRAGTVTFKNGTDYTVGYWNNTKVGKATTKVTMKGNYKGSKTATFKILPKKAGISKAVPGKKLVKVTMSTKVSATGGTVYQIQYRIKGAAKWKTTTTKNKTKTIKKLKKGKQYQIRVRAYKSVSGSKYYGAWSKVKTTKKVK